VDLEPYSVAIARGDGLVAHTGHVLMYVADSTGASALLKALDTAGQSAGRTLVKALAAIALGPDSALVSPFGVLVPADDGLQLILRGPVAAHIEADSGNRTVVGDRALTWVDETLRDPVNTVTISTQDAALNPDPHTDLRAGVVSGGGFVMYRKAKAHAAVRPASAAAAITPEQRGAPPPTPHQRQAPAKPAPQHQPPYQRPGSPPPKPATPTAEPPPGLGALCLDDEARYPLDRPYVIGRNPMIDNAVRNAHASALFLPDDPQISRVHAYVTIDSGTVFVRDAGTPGGTFVAAPGDATWSRVGEQPMALKPGWCLRIGQRILMYQKASSAQ
jgi:FHA domain